MGKPRLIILIRHAQSEGNKNREIHQVVPDHRVKLTDEGWKQAEDAGRRLKTVLRPDDTLQIYTSPYRRTRETTEGILKTLTARNDPDDPDAAPSPFSRSKIKVYEDPRLREQSFGNLQPSSAEMEEMWRERANYGHFFYRIPNGESAADAYDRISGFNESLWRQFGEKEFPSVCVLVTHGLMTRVFLMKWYHWSVEYFEDLRNVNHCEFILMRQNLESGKFVLENQMRTWSELKRQRAEQARSQEAVEEPQRRYTLSHFLKTQSPDIPPRHWKGSASAKPPVSTDRDNRNQHGAPDIALPPAASSAQKTSNEDDDHPGGPQDVAGHDSTLLPTSPKTAARFSLPFREYQHTSALSSGSVTPGVTTPHEMPEQENYFSNPASSSGGAGGGPMSRAIAGVANHPTRKYTPEDIERWVKESGMAGSRQADALGDEPNEERFDDGGKVSRARLEKVTEEAIVGIEKREGRDRVDA